MSMSQATRYLQIQSPLGENALLLDAFRGREELSRLFRFELDLLSENAAIEAPQIVGKPVGFSLADVNDGRRHFHGVISRFVAGEEDDKGHRNYRAEVVPWLWFLTRTSDCRIFQQKTAVEIIEQVFQDLGFQDFEKGKVTQSHPKRDYCVQYRETDFNFVSRLMEEEGIYYYFRHEKSRHVLVMADDDQGYMTIAESTVDFPHDAANYASKDHLTHWEHRFEFRSGKWAQQDYNFDTLQNLMTNGNSGLPLPDASKYEFYDYPGDYVEKPVGTSYTDIRIQEEEQQYDIVSGGGSCRSFTPGGKFAIGKHRSKSEQGLKFVLTSVNHAAHEPRSYGSGGGSGEDYTNSFVCIPAKVKFRPARLTPKPVVQGIQTAVVVGPKGEEIFCDKFGRVKVQFHWDREGKKDEKSSCWIRTAHNIAGRQWGFQAVPRIGQEVVVDFLEGDPDKPLIVGSVYNTDQMPHYALPANNSRSYIKTNSTKGGNGYNELMFEDKKDDERLFFHAQKNMDTRVRNDSKERIYGHRHQIIGWEKDGSKGGDQREKVWQDKHLTVKRHQVEHIEGNFQLQVGGGEADSGGDVDVEIEKNRKENIGKDSHLTVGGKRSEQVTGVYSLTVDSKLQQKVKQDVGVEAGMNIHLKAGMNLVIEAGMQITLKGPGGFVSIGPDGVTIQGTLVKINSGGAAGSGAGCSPEPPEKPEKAKPTEPEQAFDSKTGMKSSSG